MESLIGVALWTGAGLGVLAVALAVARPDKRRVALLVAGLAFIPIGVLGILSIGALFLVAAVVCLALAAFGPPGTAGNTVESPK